MYKAKQHIKLFPKVSSRKTKLGELTHINLWGKYTVKSIHGNKYYLLLLDNATVKFIKEKLNALDEVIHYLTYLTMQGCTLRAIQIDEGGEFVNEKLKSWCASHGIVVCITAPYSPSQNGVAKHMNQMLVKLGRAMLIAKDLPEFLWEYAVAYAAYVRNRTFTKHLLNSMSYQGWRSLHSPTHFLQTPCGLSVLYKDVTGTPCKSWGGG
jgi:hypothetical protein